MTQDPSETDRHPDRSQPLPESVRAQTRPEVWGMSRPDHHHPLDLSIYIAVYLPSAEARKT
jgi:hypothetical protein